MKKGPLGNLKKRKNKKVNKCDEGHSLNKESSECPSTRKIINEEDTPPQQLIY